MSLEELKQQRANIKKNISRIKNIVEASIRPGGKTLSVAEYKCRLGILESYFKNVLSTQTDIERLDSEDGGRADLEELYITTKLAIQSQLTEDHNATISDSTCVMQASSKLPKLKLPSFSGKYSEYTNFITSVGSPNETPCKLPYVKNTCTLIYSTLIQIHIKLNNSNVVLILICTYRYTYIHMYILTCHSHTTDCTYAYRYIHTHAYVHMHKTFKVNSHWNFTVVSRHRIFLLCEYTLYIVWITYIMSWEHQINQSNRWPSKQTHRFIIYTAQVILIFALILLRLGKTLPILHFGAQRGAGVF